MTLWPHRGFVLEIGDGNLGKVPRGRWRKKQLGTPSWTLSLEQLVPETDRLELGVCKAGGAWGRHLTCTGQSTQPSKESSPRACQ